MKTSSLSAIAFLCLALGGCTTTAFKQYTGSQQSWPISTGAYVSTDTAVPVFYGPPPRSYDVMGFLDTHRWPANDDVVVRKAALSAKGIGADAIVLVNVASHYTGLVSTVGTTYASSYQLEHFAPPLMTGTAVPILDDYAGAILIRFRDGDGKGMAK